MFHKEKIASHEGGEMNEFDGLPPATHLVEANDVSKLRYGLYQRAFGQEGKVEPLRAKLEARIKPNTMARLKLFCDDVENGFPLLDEVIDEALHDYLSRRFW
jgi:hypothetical protein